MIVKGESCEPHSLNHKGHMKYERIGTEYGSRLRYIEKRRIYETEAEK